MKAPHLQGNKIHFVSLGCARNLVDTEVMLGLVIQAGYEITDQTESADFLVVNTCAFLESAREESCQAIGSLFVQKKKDAKVIVAGCMVQKHREELKSRFPDIHYFIGSGDVEKILQAVSSPAEGEAVTTAKSYLEWGEVPRTLSTPKHYAYLKIAEGCAKQCAFCIIPKIKGTLKSKTKERVIQEFRSLLQRGVKEVILIAQDLGDWGKERGKLERLEHLIAEMLKEPGDFWLRFLYLYPDEITDELIALMKSDPRICPYLDMPIQHVSDPILKAMRRKTTKTDILHTLTKLRKAIPHIVIRTSLMVGFPGETDEQFEELVSFLKEYPIDQVGIFKYSKEEESLSAKMEGHISESVKEARFQKLAKVQQKMAAKQGKRFVGKTLRVLVEGYHPESEFLMRGRFYGQCPEIDGMVVINDGTHVSEFSTFYDVKITGVLGYDLLGKVLKPKEAPKKALKLAPSLAIVS